MRRSGRPTWTVPKGARELYDAYRQVGLTLEDFEGPRFSRVAHIRHLIESRVLDERLRHNHV